MLDKTLTGTGVTLGIVAAILSPHVMEKLSSDQFFWVIMLALTLTALGSSIIPAIKAEPKLSQVREKRNKKIQEAVKSADIAVDQKITEIVDAEKKI